MEKVAKDILSQIFRAVGVQRQTHRDGYVHDSPPAFVGSQDETEAAGFDAAHRVHAILVYYASAQPGGGSPADDPSQPAKKPRKGRNNVAPPKEYPSINDGFVTEA